MSTFAWRAWDVLGASAAPKFVAREIAVLLIVAASLLVFRTLRERCLIVWIAGWLAYLASHHTLLSNSSSYSAPLGHAEFVVAIALFVAGTFLYSGTRGFIGPLLGIGVGLTAFAAAQGIYWPNSVTLRFALELSYRLLALSAAIQILRFRRARKEIGSWFLAAGVLSLHLEWPPISAHIPTDAGVFFDVLLGMLLLVFDEFRIRTRRLATLNALTTNIARAAEHGPMATDALRDLQKLMDADAIWFRLRNGRQFTVFQHSGLSEDFLRFRTSISSNDTIERIP